MTQPSHDSLSPEFFDRPIGAIEPNALAALAIQAAFAEPRFHYVRDAILARPDKPWIGFNPVRRFSSAPFVNRMQKSLAVFPNKLAHEHVAKTLRYKNFVDLTNELAIHDLHQACIAAERLGYYAVRDNFNQAENVAALLIREYKLMTQGVIPRVLGHAHPSHAQEAKISQDEICIRKGAAIVAAIERVLHENTTFNEGVIGRNDLEAISSVMSQGRKNLKSHPDMAAMIDPQHNPAPSSPHNGSKKQYVGGFYPRPSMESLIPKTNQPLMYFWQSHSA